MNTIYGVVIALVGLSLLYGNLMALADIRRVLKETLDHLKR